MSSHEPIEISVHHRRHKGDFWSENGGSDQELTIEDSRNMTTPSAFQDTYEDNENGDNTEIVDISLPSRRHDSAVKSFRREMTLQHHLPNSYLLNDLDLGKNGTMIHHELDGDEMSQTEAEDLVTYYRDIMACMQGKTFP